MQKNIEKQILEFTDTLAGIVRKEIVHGTLYLKLDYDNACDNVHQAIRTFYKENINPEGGVNMYFVGDEFCFDFVPAEDEAPSLNDEPLASKVDTALELEADMEQGK